MGNRLNDLTATQATEMMRQGEITATDLISDCIEQILALDPSIHAWTALDTEAALVGAKRADLNPSVGLLHGIPIALKDNIDTRDFPTTYGSGLYKDHRPVADATCVTLCKSAGAIALGKTASTEFAYRKASACRNPHNLEYSPGGSSSGSAAAVASHMVPLAVGTQTGGSVIRPASYCGIYGFKPRYGDLSFTGVKNLAPSFDTLGLMARSLDDLALFYAALHRNQFTPIDSSNIRKPKFAVYRTAFWDEAQAGAKACFDEMLHRLAHTGAALHEVRLDDLDQRMLSASWVMNKYEASRQFLSDWLDRRDGLSQAVQALVEEGLSIRLEDYHAARRTLDEARVVLNEVLDQFDAVLTLSSPGEAPHGLEDTGPVTFNFIWTAAQMNAINLPCFTGPSGLPIGMQVVSARWKHKELFELANWVDKHLK